MNPNVDVTSLMLSVFFGALCSGYVMYGQQRALSPFLSGTFFDSQPGNGQMTDRLARQQPRHGGSGPRGGAGARRPRRRAARPPRLRWFTESSGSCFLNTVAVRITAFFRTVI